MGLRVRAVLAGAAVVLASLPGAAAAHHEEGHAKPSGAVKKLEVTARTDFPYVGQPHRFDYRGSPGTAAVSVRATVTLTNGEFDPAGSGVGGPPHNVTLLLKPQCDAGLLADGCTTLATDTVGPGGKSKLVLDPKRVPPGKYTFICSVGQDEGPPFSLLFSPHATYDRQAKQWTGMTGQLAVLPDGARPKRPRRD